eukprot:jgi/Mesvir1/27829/Mv07508-RA.1
MADKPPSLPAEYQVPDVWTPPQGEMMGGMNRPTAGARREQTLPCGKHDIQLYSLGTPNGQKVTIMLEELGVDYDAWSIKIFSMDQFGSDFVKVNPNSKIPAVLDRSMDPPLRVFESGSILLYLAEKHGRFIPKDIRQRTECMNWLMWQMGTAPFLGGGFGHFYKYAPVKIQYAIDRYSMETKRICDVLDKQLEGKTYVCGEEYTIADMAIFPWIRCLEVGYGAAKFLSLHEYKNVQRWLGTVGSRDAVKRGLRVNGMYPGDLTERHSPADFDQAPATQS